MAGLGSLADKFRTGGGKNASPWSWESLNKAAPKLTEQDPYKAAFGKQAPDPWAARGLPSPEEYQAPTDKYNQMAHQGGYGIGADALSQFQANPLEGQNLNLGGGAMPELDRVSRYGHGLGGYFRQGIEGLQKFGNDPANRQAAGQGLLAGALASGQIDPATLQQIMLMQQLGGSFNPYR